MSPDATQGEALVQCCLLLLIEFEPKLIVMSRSIILIIGRFVHPPAQTIDLLAELRVIPAFDFILLLFLSVDNLLDPGSRRRPEIGKYAQYHRVQCCRDPQEL